MTELAQTTIRFQSALVGDNWLNDVAITFSVDGIISAINSDAKNADANSEINGSETSLDLIALPGMVNVHSHAFQRGFAGLSEFRTATNDSFWTWRDLMYRFVKRLTPNDVFVIARQLYLEMIAAGYTWVGEFHYLHNATGGDVYTNLNEMSVAIHRAARDVGIGLCHLPVLYQRGGFEDEPLVPGQDRFVLSDDQFVELVSQCHTQWSAEPNFQIGIALHSLRAVNSTVGGRIVSGIKHSIGEIPIHIHVAEQTAEVESCLAKHDLRPVEYLFDQFEVNNNWCLIHATHLDDREIRRLVDSKATVGLCPTTEANLGDGFFRAKEFLDMRGEISIGSDSHSSIDIREELRLLEYGQRLQRQSRAVLGTNDHSVGRRLYESACTGGANAIGINSGEIKVGNRADFTLVDPNHPAIGGATEDRLLDRTIFTNVGNPIVGAVVSGRVFDSRSESFQNAFSISSRQFNSLCSKLIESD